MHRAKLAQIESINAVVRKVFLKASLSADADSINTLDKLTCIQARIQRGREWPLDFNSFAPIIISLSAVVVQVIIAVVKVRPGTFG